MKKEEFNKLYKLDCSKHIEKKDCGNGRKLSYLSWAWAWAEFKNMHPNATYEVVKFDGLPYLVDMNMGIVVYTKVTVDELTHEMWLPVMDSSNKAMKLESYQYNVFDPQKRQYVTKTVKAADMFDINKTIMRCLTKNLAMFGLGLSIYAGEDVPQPLSEEEEGALAEDYRQQHQQAPAAPAPEQKPATKRTATKKASQELPPQQQTRASVTMNDKERLSSIIDWTMRQPDTTTAIQKISIAYDWEQAALDYVIKEVKERFNFINDLNGNNQ